MIKCVRCGDEYNAEDLRELREMGEEYNKEPFLCPDCFFADRPQTDACNPY